MEAKAVGMRKQQAKQNKLIYKMLPKVVVQQLNKGETVAESFETATLYFSSVVEFNSITNKCSALEVMKLTTNTFHFTYNMTKNFPNN